MTENSFRGPFRRVYAITITWDDGFVVGSGQPISLTTDSPLAQDSTGAAFLPGSSFRGVLRDWAEREHGRLGLEARVVGMLFGPRAEENEKSPRAGRLQTPDSAPCRVEGKAAAVELRDRIRLSEVRGSVEKGGKFDLEVCLAATTTIGLTYQGQGADDSELLLLDHLLRLLFLGVLGMGGQNGTGLGMVTEAIVHYRDQDRTTWEGLADYWEEQLDPSRPFVGRALPVQAAQVAKPTDPPAPRSLREPWHWQILAVNIGFDGPMLTADPLRTISKPGGPEGKSFDAAFLVGPDGKPRFRGSSLRGATRTYLRDWMSTGDRETLFGSAKGPRDPQNPHKNLPGRRGLVRAGTGRYAGPEPVTTARQSHVALDRLTGWSVTRALFDTLALASPVFTHRVALYWHDGQEPLVQEFIYSLRDLGQGAFSLGSRTRRGYGRVAWVKIASLGQSPGQTTVHQLVQEACHG